MKIYASQVIATFLSIFIIIGSHCFAKQWVLVGAVEGKDCQSSTLVIIDQCNGRVKQTIGTIDANTHGLAYNPVTGVLYYITTPCDLSLDCCLGTFDISNGGGKANPAIPMKANVNAITSSARGDLFGWATDGADLVRIDNGNGEVYKYPSSNLTGNQFCIDFNEEGILFLLDVSDLYTICTKTGAATFKGDLGTIPYGLYGKFNPCTKDLWVLCEKDDGTDLREFYICDTENKSILNSINSTNNLRAIAFVQNFPPNALSGTQKRDQFFTETEYFNELNFWLIDPGLATGFRIYREGKLIAELPSTATRYIDHNQRKKKAVEYSVVAVFTDGTTSQPQSVVVQ